LLRHLRNARVCLDNTSVTGDLAILLRTAAAIVSGESSH